MDTSHDLRATSDQMLTLIDHLRELEGTKRAEVVGSQAFIERASEIERLSRVVFRWAGIQLQLAEATVGAVQRGELDRTSLERIPPRPLERILANWREAQLRFEIARPGSPEAASATDDIERLREEFRATQDAMMRAASGTAGSTERTSPDPSEPGPQADRSTSPG
jgi:hypothetical protein